MMLSESARASHILVVGSPEKVIDALSDISRCGTELDRDMKGIDVVYRTPEFEACAVKILVRHSTVDNKHAFETLLSRKFLNGGAIFVRSVIQDRPFLEIKL